MKKIYTLFAAAFAVLTVASCNMDLKPLKSIAYDPDAQLIETSSDLTSFEIGIMSRFRSTLGGDYDVTEELMMDGFNATSNFGNRYGTVHRANNTFTSTNEYVEGIWAGYYTALKDYNILIAALDNVPEALAEDAATVKGEALFFRAYTYLQLARHWGKAYSSTADTDLCVPLVLVYDQLEKPARATVAAVYEQIGKDLETAAELLADVKGSPRAIRPTYDAVRALQARYYLDIHDTENALKAADDVITSAAGYALASTAAEMKAEFVDDKGKEPILQLYTEKPSELPNSKNLFTYNQNNPDGVEIYGPDYLPSGKLLNSYTTTDLRREAWFTSTKHSLEYNRISYNDVFVFVKFEGNPALATTLLNGCTSPKPLKIGEMYLIAAEAALEAGETGTAAGYLNTLQTKRGTVATDATWDNLKKEWFKETVGEGLRMSCLKRWGDGFTARTAQQKALDGAILMTGEYYEQRAMAASDRAFCWPIPSYEIKVNENIASQQNPGYSAE